MGMCVSMFGDVVDMEILFLGDDSKIGKDRLRDALDWHWMTGLVGSIFCRYSAFVTH